MSGTKKKIKRKDLAMVGSHKPGRMTKQEQLEFDEFVIDCYNNGIPADILIESGFNKNTVYDKYDELEKREREVIKKNYEQRVLENREKELLACNHQMFKTLRILSSIESQIQGYDSSEEVPVVLYQQWSSISKILSDLRKERRSYYEDVTEEDVRKIVQDEIIANETRKKEMQKNQKKELENVPVESKVDDSSATEPETVTQEVNQTEKLEMGKHDGG